MRAGQEHSAAHAASGAEAGRSLRSLRDDTMGSTARTRPAGALPNMDPAFSGQAPWFTRLTSTPTPPQCSRLTRVPVGACSTPGPGPACWPPAPQPPRHPRSRAAGLTQVVLVPVRGVGQRAEVGRGPRASALRLRLLQVLKELRCLVQAQVPILGVQLLLYLPCGHGDGAEPGSATTAQLGSRHMRRHAAGSDARRMTGRTPQRPGRTLPTLAGPRSPAPSGSPP